MSRATKQRRNHKRVETPVWRKRMAAATPWALLIVLFGALGSAVIFLPRALDAWPIEQVSVKGISTDVRRQQLSARLGSEVAGQNFFTVSLDDLQQSAASLDWVQSANVSRQWPSTLTIQIKEQVPVAIWNGDQLISNQGATFSAPDDLSALTLPRLQGPEKRLDEVMRYYHSVSQALAGLALTIKKLSVNDRLTAYITLSDGMKLIVDRDNFAYKLQRFVAFYKKVLKPEGRVVKTADLRYADGVAVTFSQSTAAQDNRA